MSRTQTLIARALTLSIAIGLAACGAKKPAPSQPPAAPTASTKPSEDAVPVAPTVSVLADAYAPIAAKIIEGARADRAELWKKLEELTVHIGPRLAGSEGLDKAVRWASETMASEGHANIKVEKVMVPNWKRGPESARLVSPRTSSLRIIGLGGTVPTPRRGIKAEVLVVSSKEELDKRGAEAKGKIVLFNVVMAPYDRAKGDGYDAVFPYRGSGADWAAEHGAVAVLVRSLTTRSLATPHTGGLRYKTKVKLPAAAITTEGAELLASLAARGPVKVELKLASTQGKDVESGNVIGEIVGTEKPDEIVLIGAHIDSWDLGGGAHDDGGGCVIMMQTLTLLKRLGLSPKRTIRVVLFTNEENGLRGAFQYAKDHAAKLPNHVVVLESDGGVFAPRGFLVEGKRGLEHTHEIAKLMSGIREMEVKPGFSGADLIPLTARGVPGVGHWVEGEHYFDLHHTEADTIDKVDPAELADNLAAVAIFAFVAADMPERFGGDHVELAPKPRE